MGNDSPPHLSPNLHFNLQIKMIKHKLRSQVGLLNTLQIGSMASNFLENPNERIYVLERLVAAIDSVDPLIATSGFREAIQCSREISRHWYKISP